MIKELSCINKDVNFYLVEITSKKNNQTYKAIALKYDNKLYIIKFI